MWYLSPFGVSTTKYLKLHNLRRRDLFNLQLWWLKAQIAWYLLLWAPLPGSQCAREVERETAASRKGPGAWEVPWHLLIVTHDCNS